MSIHAFSFDGEKRAGTQADFKIYIELLTRH